MFNVKFRGYFWFFFSLRSTTSATLQTVYTSRERTNSLESRLAKHSSTNARRRVSDLVTSTSRPGRVVTTRHNPSQPITTQRPSSRNPEFKRWSAELCHGSPMALSHPVVQVFSLNISSITGYTANPVLGFYSAAKFG